MLYNDSVFWTNNFVLFPDSIRYGVNNCVLFRDSIWHGLKILFRFVIRYVMDLNFFYVMVFLLLNIHPNNKIS